MDQHLKIKQQKIITINLILLAIWTWILMTFVTMYKTETWLLDINPFYGGTLWALYFLALIYVHFFVTRRILLNLLITSLLFALSHFIAFQLIEKFMNYLMISDNGKTPLGWTFKYRFLDIFIVNVLLLLSLKVVRKIIPVKSKMLSQQTNEYKFDLEIIVPATIEVVHMADKVRFRGSKEDIALFVKEFYRLKPLKSGQFCKLGDYVLKVSDYITADREKRNVIELPAAAWAVMGSKFSEVAYEDEDNPFDFNDCGYTDKNPFDIGVEVMDLPIRYMEFYEDGTYEQKVINR